MVELAYRGPDCDLSPDPVMMAEFCRWWFAAADNGVLEIGWMNPVTGDLTEFQQFERDDIPALAATATQINMVAGQSVYIRAATVRSHPFPPYTGDRDFVQATGIWSDIDSDDDLKHAQNVKTMVRPNAQVITGTVPTLRVQSWFRTAIPIVSREMVRDLNVRLHRLYGGDSAVINPSRLMRLPGTIAWPWKDPEIRIPELVRLILPEPGSGRTPAYPIAALTTQLPRDDSVPINGTVHEPFDFGIRGLSSVASHINAIKAGRQWHNHMIRLVAHWVGQGRTTAEIMGHCADWTLAGYAVADTRKEVAAAIDGARRKWGVPDQENLIGAEPDKPFGEAVFDPWGEPVAPAFPIHALPDVIRAYTESRARIMGADPCAIAWAALSAASAALDGRTRLKMKRYDTWSVPPTIWVALIGRSSSKKSPIIGEAWRPLDALQHIAIRAYADQVAAHNRLPKDERKETESPPKPRRLISNDATMEGTQDILACQDRGIAMLRDELAGFIGGLDKYSNGGKGGADRAFFLQAYNGGPYVVDRVGRGTVSINNLLITICGGIQPDKLAQFHDLTDDGLWQRFVPIIVQQAEMGTDEDDAGPVSDYTLRIQGMVDASRGDIASLSNDAHDIRAEIEKEIFRLERTEPMGPRFASFVGKLPGLFGRLCLVLSYLEPRGIGYVISRRTAEMARTLIMNCVVPHAVSVYMTMGESGASVEAMRGIASYILTKSPSRIVISDLTSAVRACRNKTVQEVGKMLSPLVAGGWLLPENELPTNRSWLCNPALPGVFAARAELERDRKAALRTLLMEPGDDGIVS